MIHSPPVGNCHGPTDWALPDSRRDRFSGGQGTVYRAFDPDTGQIVALKVLHRFLSSDSDYVERFRREASLASSIDHPNVVKIFEVGQDGDQHFMALEFLPESLARLVEGGGQMRLDRATEFGIQIADGLAEAHALGIVHRDIKPQNILIGADGVAKVTDFGIARSDVMTSMTATGAVMGSPHYMSPEQSRGEDVDRRSDVYSLGCMLYQMVTGELPFKGITPLAVIRQQIDAEPTPVRELRADLPRDWSPWSNEQWPRTPETGSRACPTCLRPFAMALPEVEAKPRARGRPRVEATVAPPVTPTQPAERPSVTWMENWANVWQRTHRRRWAWVGTFLSVALALTIAGVRLGAFDQVGEFIGVSSPATPEVAVLTSTPPDQVILVPAPAGQVVTSVPVVVVVAAAKSTRLGSPEGQITIDIGVGAVRDDVTSHLPARDDRPDSPTALGVRGL